MTPKYDLTETEVFGMIRDAFYQGAERDENCFYDEAIPLFEAYILELYPRFIHLL